LKRSIIKIDDNKCNGCGQCVPDCPEGALQIIEGKARLVSDLFCDGLGACIGTCPEGAISVEEREAEAYDERKVMDNVVLQGEAVIKAHLKHLDDHGEAGFLNTAIDYLKEKRIDVPEFKEETTGCSGHSCPGSTAVELKSKDETTVSQNHAAQQSELQQWPVQLKLLNPSASYFENADLLIAADCVPFAYADFHSRFLKGKIVINFCPKLDPYADEYIEKLVAILSLHEIRSISVVRMEVPCCGGVGVLLQKAMEKSGKNILMREYVISLKGEIL